LAKERTSPNIRLSRPINYNIPFNALQWGSKITSLMTILTENISCKSPEIHICTKSVR